MDPIPHWGRAGEPPKIPVLLPCRQELDSKQPQGFPKMNRKKLADEIRAAGTGLRFADGPVFVSMRQSGRMTSLNSPKSKTGFSDRQIIRIAATCSACDAFASKVDRELAEMMADSYPSFARLIWLCIDHESSCEATPCTSVSEVASKQFAAAKARFEASRRARGVENGTKNSPVQNKENEQELREEKELKAALKTFFAFRDELRDVRRSTTKAKKTSPKKAIRKKATEAKKKPTKKKAAKKASKRRKRK